MTETRRPTSPGAEEILGLYFPVLDHGFVSLVDYMGTDECIERAARVSYGYGTRKAQMTRGLLRYLRRHLHTTPTEMVELKFHCCMPMFVARQWIRHRTACLAGDAQLYFDLPGAEKRGRRQRHNVAIADFHRMWTQGTAHRDSLSRMQLRNCDEASGEITHTNVVDVWESGVKPVFRVTLENGYTLKMSKDHRCLTERGWLTLEQATGLRLTSRRGVTWSGDAPAFAVNGAPAYRDREWLSARRAEGLGIDEIAARAGISYHSIRKYLKQYGLEFSAGEKARLAGLSQRGQRRTPSKPRAMSAVHLATIRRARSGSASNFWKGGVSTEREGIGRWTTQVAARVHAVSSDADLTRFWHGRARQPHPQGKRRPTPTRLVRTFSRVAHIDYVGEEMTYDLEVAGPYHNFVADGFVVHNSVNEYSGRYSLMPMLFYTPSEEQLQTQSAKNNQGRSGQSVPAEQYQEAIRRWNEIRKLSQSAYEWMTNQEMARELARIDLPLSTYTQWYWKVDLHNLQHFLKLRVDSHAQWEIQEYGRVMAGMLKKLAPHSYEAWIDYDVCGTRMSRMELEALRKLVSASDQGLRAGSASLDTPALEALGLSKRELGELVTKLSAAERPDFELDMSQAKPAEHFAERMNAAVPKGDKSPLE